MLHVRSNIIELSPFLQWHVYYNNDNKYTNTRMVLAELLPVKRTCDIFKDKNISQIFWWFIFRFAQWAAYSKCITSEINALFKKQNYDGIILFTEFLVKVTLNLIHSRVHKVKLTNCYGIHRLLRYLGNHLSKRKLHNEQTSCHGNTNDKVVQFDIVNKQFWLETPAVSLYNTSLRHLFVLFQSCLK